MKLISHRGNLYGPHDQLVCPHGENHPDRIDFCIQNEFDVEIDLWCKGVDLWLGHDHPLYKTDIYWLIARYKNLFIHCKNVEAAHVLSPIKQLNWFMHDQDMCSVTSWGQFWHAPHNRDYCNRKSICVLPERYWIGNEITIPLNVYGICSDYIGSIKNEKSRHCC